MLRGKLYLDLFMFCFLYLVYLLCLKQSTAFQSCMLLGSLLQSSFVELVMCEGALLQRSVSLLLEARVSHNNGSECTTHPAHDNTWNKGEVWKKSVFTTDHLFSNRRSLTCSWKFSFFFHTSWEVRTPANKKAFYREWASCPHQFHSFLGEIAVLFLWLYCNFP